MRRLLLDHNVPKGVRSILSEHEVVTAYQMGWSALTNGKLLDAAERGGFHTLLTGDRNLVYQQNLAQRSIAIVALTTTHWPTLRANAHAVQEAVERAAEGTYVTVPLPRPPLPRPPLHRRPPPSS
jgi:hypothetical protein